MTATKSRSSRTAWGVGSEYERNDQTQTASRVEASDIVAEGLGVPAGSEVYARTRLVKEGTQPTHTLTSYYRPEKDLLNRHAVPRWSIC